MLDAHKRVLDGFGGIIAAANQGDKAELKKWQMDCELQISIASGIFYDAKYAGQTASYRKELLDEFRVKADSTGDKLLNDPVLRPYLEKYNNVFSHAGFVTAELEDDGAKVDGKAMKDMMGFYIASISNGEKVEKKSGTKPSDFSQFSGGKHGAGEGLGERYDFQEEYNQPYKKLGKLSGSGAAHMDPKKCQHEWRTVKEQQCRDCKGDKQALACEKCRWHFHVACRCFENAGTVYPCASLTMGGDTCCVCGEHGKHGYQRCKECHASYCGSCRVKML